MRWNTFTSAGCAVLLATGLLQAPLAAQSLPVPAPAAVPASQPVPPPPTPAGARAWLLMDAASGQVLAGENIDEEVEPASITKVMTGYVVAAELKHGKIKATDEVAISENAWRQGGAGTDGSFSALAVNSRVPLEDVLKGLVIQSGNDAAIALAEHVAGSEETFVALMNQTAQRLGLTHTHFENAHGLSAPGHHSSAHDIALLSRALIRDFPDHYALYKVKEYTYNGIRQYNRNNLLWKDPSVDGIKTGHTSAAGYCLAASAKRGDTRLISVVMGIAATRQKDGFKMREDGNLALLNYGFRFFESHQLYAPGAVVASPPLFKGATDVARLGVARAALVTIPRGAYPRLKAQMNVPKPLLAPIRKGAKVGTLSVMLGDQEVLSTPLIALDEYPEAGFMGRMWDSARLWWEKD